MSDLRDHFSPELVAAVEALVDERLAAALAERENATAPTWLSIAESADYLRVSERTVSRWLKRGRIRSTCVGRRRLVRRDDLDSVSDQVSIG